MDTTVPSPERFVLFALERGRYALRLETVERVVPSLELTPLPNSPEIVLGVFSLGGQIIPVMNLRRRFGLPERELQLTDCFVVASAADRVVALVVDDTMGIVEVPPTEIVPVSAFMGELPQIAGVIRLRSDIVLIHDLARFLSLDEARKLDSALAEVASS